MPVLTCPNRDLLGEYSLGRLSDEHSDQISAHISSCENCQRVLQDIADPRDPIVTALKSRVSEDPFTAEPERQEALALVRAIGREPSFVSRPYMPSEELGEIGHYRLLAKLGEGGMGAVYKALHTKLDKVVALKVLPADRLQHPDAVSRFQREMKAVGKLSHPNIVAAHDAGEIDGKNYLVMELVEGLDLSDLVRRVGPLKAADACELIRQAAVGLRHAHERGLVHRDIKPSNLMLAFSDQPSAISDNSTQSQIGDRKSAILKILDLGLALLAGEPVAAQRDLTGTGQLVGTFDYMAPEQGSDSHQVDIRADIYSLGATLYKLLCGESPFPASKYNTPAKMLTALATVAPPSIADKRDDLPPELIAIVVRMLAKNPGDRFATPAEVADALAPFAAESDLSALLQLATIKTTGTPSVDQSKTPTDAFLSRPSTGTEVTLDQVTKMLDKQSSSGSGDSPAATNGSRVDQPAPKPNSRASGSPPRSRNRSIAAAFGGIVLLGIVTLIFQTSGGTMIVEIDDPEGLIQVTVEGQDVLITDKHKNGEPIKLRPDDYKLHVTRGDLEFTTDNFTLKRGDTVVLHVTATVRQVQVVQDEKVIGRGEVGANSIDDPDRRASLIALNAGGQVVIQVEGASSAVTVALRDELPDQAFKLGSVYFRSTARIITKEEFDRFCEALKTTGHNSMWEFALYGPHVTDDWLVNLHGMTINLIDLWGTSVSDMGIEHLREIKDLKSLSFARAEISDQGVRTLAGIETVTSLDLSDTNVTDVGLRTLRALDLLLLDLSGTQATNEGLAYVAVHGRLKHLRLASCDQISDDGMRYLSTMQELENIDIAGTPITDDGLLHLAGLTNLHAIAFPSNEKITEAGLAVLDNFPHLTHLNLFGVKIGGPTVARIAKLSTLDNLDIGWPTMIDADLVELSTLRQISYLDLRNSSVTDAGIAHLETMPQLRYVDLAGAKVTLEGVAKLKRALPECQITSDFTDEQIAAAMEVLKKVQK